MTTNLLQEMSLHDLSFKTPQLNCNQLSLLLQMQITVLPTLLLHRTKFLIMVKHTNVLAVHNNQAKSE